MSGESVLILAGQREGVVDPLCAESGVERKAIIPINGRPMINYVLDALDQADLQSPYHVSGFDAGYDGRLTQSPSAPGPAGSARAALEAGIEYPVLMTTADHALLNKAMLESFLSQARASGADFCVGLADKTIIQPAYPHVRRTYLKFKDRSVSGCNLFYIARPDGVAAIRFWEKAQHLRKQPVKLAKSLGWGVLFRYVFGRLTLDGAIDYAAKKLGISAAAILIPIAEAAIDVDKPDDRILVEQILKATPHER